MERFVPTEKLSKKEKELLAKKRRVTWAINPVTRKPQNPKAYNRNASKKKLQKGDDLTFGASFYFAYLYTNLV